ncbi:MAG: DUF1152 domain-containing protein [Candidatus Hadarchaeales archaeon]
MRGSLESVAKRSKKAMVVGIGGGGDVVGAIPTSNYLRMLGCETVLGGLTWERYVNDPEPGPRRMDEIVNITRISDTVGIANPSTRTVKGVRFTESAVAEVIREDVLLIDPNQGVRGLVKGINAAAGKMGVDLFVGVDTGGDVLATGKEEGLRSMLADSMMLASMVKIDIPSILGVLGCCTDGELTLEQFTERLSAVAEYGGLLGARGLTPEDIDMLERVIPATKTESSALAVKAAKGLRGLIPIRGGYRKALITPFSAITFYLDPFVVFEKVNGIARELVNTKTIEEADEILRKAGLPSELAFQRSGEWRKYLGSGG